MATEAKASVILVQLAKFDSVDLEDHPEKKVEALKLCKQLTAALEAPIDRAVDYIFKVSKTLLQLYIESN